MYTILSSNIRSFLSLLDVCFYTSISHSTQITFVTCYSISIRAQYSLEFQLKISRVFACCQTRAISPKHEKRSCISSRKHEKLDHLHSDKQIDLGIILFIQMGRIFDFQWNKHFFLFSPSNWKWFMIGYELSLKGPIYHDKKWMSLSLQALCCFTMFSWTFLHEVFSWKTWYTEDVVYLEALIIY